MTLWLSSGTTGSKIPFSIRVRDHEREAALRDTNIVVSITTVDAIKGVYEVAIMVADVQPDADTVPDLKAIVS